MQKQSRCGLILMPILAGLWFSPTWSLPTTNAQQDAKEAEIERLRKENAVLQELVKKLQQKMLQAEPEQAKMKNVLAEAVIRAKTIQLRNESLTERIRGLERALAPKKADPPKGNDFPLAKPNPPPTKLDGLIEKVDPKDGSLVVISVGADAGLAKGHTLEVYRLKPAPKYLGTIQIIEVTQHKAVGRLLRRANAPVVTLDVGDNVASSFNAPAEPKKNE
jgi:hypothetical protein